MHLQKGKAKFFRRISPFSHIRSQCILLKNIWQRSNAHTRFFPQHGNIIVRHLVYSDSFQPGLKMHWFVQIWSQVRKSHLFRGEKRAYDTQSKSLRKRGTSSWKINPRIIRFDGKNEVALSRQKSVNFAFSQVRHISSRESSEGSLEGLGEELIEIEVPPPRSFERAPSCLWLCDTSYVGVKIFHLLMKWICCLQGRQPIEMRLLIGKITMSTSKLT